MDWKQAVQEQESDSDEDINNEYNLHQKKGEDSFSEEDDDPLGGEAELNKFGAVGRDKNGFAIKRDPSQSKRTKNEKAVPTVLTFVDMSKLKYLSKSVSASDKLSRKHAPVQIPETVASAILEAASEEDSDDADDKPIDSIPVVPQTPAQLAGDVINELIGLVLESASEKLDQNQIASNSLLQKNKHKLHKQVFVKVRVGDNPMQSESDSKLSQTQDPKTFKKSLNQNKPGFGKSRDPHTSKSFRKTLESRKDRRSLIKLPPQ